MEANYVGCQSSWFTSRISRYIYTALVLTWLRVSSTMWIKWNGFFWNGVAKDVTASWIRPSSRMLEDDIIMFLSTLRRRYNPDDLRMFEISYQQREKPGYKVEAPYASTFVAFFARLDRFRITHYESSDSILGKKHPMRPHRIESFGMWGCLHRI